VEKVMSRLVWYIVTVDGRIVPMRKTYKKARFKKQMGRYNYGVGFQKKGR
jgi:hypothetical protein